MPPRRGEESRALGLSLDPNSPRLTDTLFSPCFVFFCASLVYGAEEGAIKRSP